MTTHDFYESLELSYSYTDAPWWEEVYRNAFGDEFEGMADLRSDGSQQRAGVDRYVILKNRPAITVDEKVRTGDWPDIALEVWSNWERCSAHAPLDFDGWAVKPRACDYVAYAFATTGVCYLLPSDLLRRAVARNWRSWRALAGYCVDQFHGRRFIRGAHGFGWIVAPNPGYHTVSLAVPIPIILDAIADAMVVSFAAEAS